VAGGAGADRGAAHQRASGPARCRALRAGPRLPPGPRTAARGAPAGPASGGAVVSPPLVAEAAAVRSLRREGDPRAAVRSPGRDAAERGGAGPAARVPPPRARRAPRERRPRRGLRRRPASRGRRSLRAEGRGGAAGAGRGDASRGACGHRALPEPRPLPGRRAGPVDPVRRVDPGGRDRRPRAAGGGGAAAVREPGRPLHGQPGAGGQGQPHGEPALPGPRAHAHERRGAGLGRRRRARAARGGARDPGRMKEEGTVEDGFKVLEERIQRAAERLKELANENKALRSEASRASERAERAERELGALKERAGSSAADAEKVEALAGELKTLRAEREELRARVEKLAGLLERL